jgi:hypothetical protein
MSNWTYHEIEREEASTWFINGVRATYTRIAWIDQFIFKIVYWWRFARNIKNMIGATHGEDSEQNCYIVDICDDWSYGDKPLTITWYSSDD